jgi:hypothetical protein
MGVFVLSGTDAKSYYSHSSFGHILPGPDGKHLFTGAGFYSPHVQLIEQRRSDDTLIPATQGAFWLKLPPAGKNGEVTLEAQGRARPVATFSDFELKVPKEESIKHDFTFDKRLHVIPQARVIVTIPTSDDRLVLYRFGG